MPSASPHRTSAVLREAPVYGQIAYFAAAPGKEHELGEALEAACGRLAGELIGLWRCIIGPRGTLALLLRYPDTASMMGDRAAITEGGVVPPILVKSCSIEAYSLYDTPKVEADDACVEIRNYVLKPGRLDAMLDVWDKVLDQRLRLSGLTALLYARSGQLPKLTHIWPYADLADRFSRRGEAVEQGVWPPPGGIANVLTMESAIYVPFRNAG